jgi:tRNA/rRNA methyltransferase/tRNA (cytidine32/uridine32-2'-O)-methyltransferase
VRVLLLSNIKIVLVETSHPGNIGGVARAMKNMAMNQLRLVNPKIFPSAEATSRASGADDLLAKAGIYPTLQEAIADCQLVIGASARSRTISWPEINPRESAAKCLAQNTQTNIALVFGRENSGLTNQELDLCQYLLKIPCTPDYSSLNIAAAVQVVCYELFVAATDLTGFKNRSGLDENETPLASAEQMESFYQHLQQTLADIGFLQPEKTQSLMRKLRRIYNRTLLDTKELDILRGILRFSQNHNQDS